MTETAHTPTPWEAQSIEETGRERGAVSIIGSNLGGLVAAALPWPTELDDGDFRRVHANAEFIVRAVNSHDAMLAALKAAEAALVEYNCVISPHATVIKGGIKSNPFADKDPTVQLIRAAISAATPKD